ncbi:MAG: hypothetical protein ABMA14_18060, partial [Hyphomonadaceae bacterium]
FLSARFCRMTVRCWGARVLLSDMAADSFRNTSEAMSDTFLAALALKWRELRDAPPPAAGTLGFFPAREATEMRRLCRDAAATGAPPEAIARLWRSMCGDVAAARGLKAVYVAGGDLTLTLEAGRSYFGFGPDLIPLVGIRDALERVSTGTGALACLPWPEHAGAGQWWPMIGCGWPSLPGRKEEGPRVAIVGRIPLESSGDDDTLATAHDDHWTADKLLGEVGLKAEVVARARSLALIRISEFVAPDDRRIGLARAAGLDGLRVIGVRPRP